MNEQPGDGAFGTSASNDTDPNSDPSCVDTSRGFDPALASQEGDSVVVPRLAAVPPVSMGGGDQGSLPPIAHEETYRNADTEVAGWLASRCMEPCGWCSDPRWFHATLKLPGLKRRCTVTGYEPEGDACPLCAGSKKVWRSVVYEAIS